MKTSWMIKTSKLRTRTERIKVDDRMRDYQKILKAGVTESRMNAPEKRASM